MIGAFGFSFLDFGLGGSCGSLIWREILSSPGQAVLDNW